MSLLDRITDEDANALEKMWVASKASLVKVLSLEWTRCAKQGEYLDPLRCCEAKSIDPRR